MSEPTIMPHQYLNVADRPSEVRSPADAAWLLQSRGSLEIPYAPGDATLYRVSLVQPLPWTPLSERLVALLVRCGDRHLLIEKPRYDKIDPITWLDAGLPAGWYAGIRPLLAGLGWAIGEPVFTTQDVRDITEILRK